MDDFYLILKRLKKKKRASGKYILSCESKNVQTMHTAKICLLLHDKTSEEQNCDDEKARDDIIL